MKTLTKLGAFVVALILVFASAYVVGRVVGPPPTEAAAAPAPAAAAAPTEDGHGPGGLMISEESMTLEVFNTNWKAGQEQILEFQVQEREGKPLMQYKAQHDK